MDEPLDLSAIEEDVDLEAEGITPYRAGVVKQLLAEAKQVKMAEEALKDARETIKNLDVVRSILEESRGSYQMLARIRQEENERLRSAISEVIGFAEEHVRLSYRDADVPQVLADPVLQRARRVRDESA